MKRSWEKPEMIVLLRRKSEEVILAHCKEGSGAVQIYNGACEKGDDGCPACNT